MVQAAPSLLLRGNSHFPLTRTLGVTYANLYANANDFFDMSCSGPTAGADDQANEVERLNFPRTRFPDQPIEPEWVKIGIDRKVWLMIKQGDSYPSMSRLLQAKPSASRARTPAELWRSGVFDCFTLPYLHRRESNVFGKADEVYTTDISALPMPELKPRRRINDQKATNLSTQKSIQFTRCCSCAGTYEYSLGDLGSVCIWAGAPAGLEYVAISYVWGDVLDIAVGCAACYHVTVFPMESISKFQSIMMLAGPGATAWLDALSIDQSDPEDIASQFAVMGTIYKRASKVCVLLPKTDLIGYELLKTLSANAKQILSRPAPFVFNREDSDEVGAENKQQQEDDAALPVDVRGPNNGPQQASALYREGPSTSNLCQEFLTDLDKLVEHVPKLKYWQRAWTFQEWSLASETDVQVEASPASGKLCSVKSSVFSAASLLGQYALHNRVVGEDARIDYGRSRMDIRASFAIVKRLFPVEDCMLANDEMNTEELAFQSQFPSTGCDQLLGLRTTPRSNDDQKRARIQLMLDAFASSNRQARHEADLVACWASMCDLQYQYDKKDSLTQAVSKVIPALRKAGAPVYEFIPRNMEPALFGNGRPSFFAFGEAQQVSNAKVNVGFTGLPIFTGRSDAQVHFRALLHQNTHGFYADSSLEPLRPVEGVQFGKIVNLSEKADLTNVMRDTFYGKEDILDALYADLSELIGEASKTLPPSLARFYNFIQFKIRAISFSTGIAGYIKAWALCPRVFPLEYLLVTRENINGVFVLTAKTRTGLTSVAYLTITDQRSGTHLLRSDERGRIDLKLDTPPQIGVHGSLEKNRHYSDLRRVRCQVKLGHSFSSAMRPRRLSI